MIICIIEWIRSTYRNIWRCAFSQRTYMSGRCGINNGRSRWNCSWHNWLHFLLCIFITIQIRAQFHMFCYISGAILTRYRRTFMNLKRALRHRGFSSSVHDIICCVWCFVTMYSLPLLQTQIWFASGVLKSAFSMNRYGWWQLFG